MERDTFNIYNIRKLAEEISKNAIVSYEDLPRYDLFYLK